MGMSWWRLILALPIFIFVCARAVLLGEVTQPHGQPDPEADPEDTP